MDHVVWYDEPVKGILGSPEIWVPWQWTESQRALGTKGYVIASHDEPICAKQYNQAGYLHVGMRYFCASMAVNIALLQGHTAIYLIGIDHVETNQRFEHYDINDQDSDVCFTAASHRGIKDFIAQCNQHVPVYQCNPVVANDWPVPYKNIEELYA
jgi:hypothetical protein